MTVKQPYSEGSHAGFAENSNQVLVEAHYLGHSEQFHPWCQARTFRGVHTLGYCAKFCQVQALQSTGLLFELTGLYLKIAFFFHYRACILSCLLTQGIHLCVYTYTLCTSNLEFRNCTVLGVGRTEINFIVMM